LPRRHQGTKKISHRFHRLRGFFRHKKAQKAQTLFRPRRPRRTRRKTKKQVHCS